MIDRELPLTEPSADTRGVNPEQAQEIARLVDRFYEEARADAMLGPIFVDRVADWDRHLATMRTFWGTVAYRDGRYAGRPIDAHLPLAELTPEHFARWLELWERTVDDVVESDIGEHLKLMAHRMGTSMSHRLTGRAPSPASE